MKIYINNLEGTVEFVIPQHPILLVEDSIGYTVYSEQHIYISKFYNVEKTRRIVIHELTHAFAFSHGFEGYEHTNKRESISQFNEYYLEQIYNMTNLIMEDTL